MKVGAHGPEHLALPQVPRVRRFVGRPDARLRSPWHVRPAPRGGRRRAGFWSALRNVFPETRKGRCRFHKAANVVAALAKPWTQAPGWLWSRSGAQRTKTTRGPRSRRSALAYGARFPQGRRGDNGDRDHLGFLRVPKRTLVASAPRPSRYDKRSPPSGNGPRSPGSGIASGGLAMAFNLIEPARTAGTWSTRRIWSLSSKLAPASNGAG